MPGALRFESGLLNYSENEGEKTYIYNSMALWLWAITNSLEFQFDLDSYVHSLDSSGLGDAHVGMKLNLIGNDSGPIAMGHNSVSERFLRLLMVSGMDKLEGGIAIPFTWALPSAWSL